MLVIGHEPGTGSCSYADVDLELDEVSPRKIHDALKKKVGSKTDFDYIVCVEDDQVLAVYHDGEDYDLTSTPDEDEETWNEDNLDDDTDPDDLHEDDGDDLLDEDD